MTIVREYRSPRHYERDATLLCRRGWRVISVLQRPAPPSRLERATLGVLAQAFPAGPELLVTYVWEHGGRQPLPPSTWQRPGVHRAARIAGRWWWAIAIGAVTLLLAYGLIDFVAQ